MEKEIKITLKPNEQIEYSDIKDRNIQFIKVRNPTKKDIKLELYCWTKSIGHWIIINNNTRIISTFFEEQEKQFNPIKYRYESYSLFNPNKTNAIIYLTLV